MYITPPRLRNFVFGVEDSLVSTVGLLSGIAFAGVPENTIILTGIILIFVEAFSMGIGSYLSEYSSQTYKEQRETSSRGPINDGLIMFFSYLIAGCIPLAPYIFISQTSQAFIVSIAFSIIALFTLGVFGSKLSHTSLAKGGLRMMIVGGCAILLGTLVGNLLK